MIKSRARYYISTILVCTIAHAMSWAEPIEVTQTREIENTADHDAGFYGDRVVIHDSKVFIGLASGTDDSEINQEAVYIHDLSTGDQLQVLRPLASSVPYALFGFDFAPYGSDLVVGAPSIGLPIDGSGSLFFYEGAGFGETGSIYPVDGFSYYTFGWTVEANEEVIITSVDQVLDWPTIWNVRGTVIIYDQKTRQELSRISPESIPDYSFFGASLALDGTRLVVTTFPGLLPGGMKSPRELWMYDLKDPAAPEFMWMTDAIDYESWSQSSLVIEGDFVFFTYGVADRDLGIEQCYLSILDVRDGSLINTIELDCSVWWPQPPSVDAENDLLVIGNPRASIENAALVYQISTGELLYRLRASDIQAGEGYGQSVSIEWPYIVVSSSYNVNQQGEQGSVYVFDMIQELCPADLTYDGTLNFFDIAAFLDALSNQDPSSDFTNDGAFNFFDIADFLEAFAAGCP
jgi:FG-GAP repeat